MQVRSVECIDQNGIHNTQCEPSTRPNSMQNCYVGIACIDDIRVASTTTEYAEETPPSEKSKTAGTENEDDDKDSIDRNFDDLTAEDVSDDAGEKNVNEMNRQKAPKAMDLDDETEEDDEDEMQGDEPIGRNYHNNQFGYQYRMPRAERLLDSHTPNEPT